MARLLRGMSAAVLLACGQGAAGDPQVTVPPPPPSAFPPAPPPPSPVQPALRLLFMGNSLTYTHDIPDQVSRMAAAAGLAAPVITTSAYADFSLEDHWNLGNARELLTGAQYDRLIMQQGPSTLDESGVNLTEWSERWSDFARTNGTRPGLYVVWPPAGGNLDAGIAHYAAAADSANAAVYPVAEAWREAWSSDSTLPLYGRDGFHPSEHGSWLAALVICSVIYDRPPASFPNLFPQVISGEQETTLRAAAARAVQRFGRR